MDVRFHVETVLDDTYRSNRVRSMFNVTPEQAGRHEVQAALPLEERDWRVGLVVGPSGSGKTTIGRRLFRVHDGFDWPADRPIVDAIAPQLELDEVTAALSAVGLGTVPSWLRPFRVLSNGEKFRAELARLMLEAEGDVCIDEFTSVVDRQVAQVGAAAFAKAWRRRPSGRVVALSCHYDIVDWLQPDWILDTRNWQFHWRSLQRHPPIRLEVRRTDWRWWPALFERHHYLKLPRMIAASCYVGTVGDAPVAHVAVTTTPGQKSARMGRLVVMPEWQGIGIGTRFLDLVAEMWLRGNNPYGKPLTSLVRTAHPGLARALARRAGWVCTGSGEIADQRTADRAKRVRDQGAVLGTLSCHFRMQAGFRYVGRPPGAAGSPA